LEIPIDFGILYLAVSLAANTKYSINSFFFPVPWIAMTLQEILRKHPRAASGSSTRPHAHGNAISLMRTDLVTIRFSRRRNLVFINLIRPIPVKGWFVNEV
jgi:hypothetical protein